MKRIAMFLMGLTLVACQSAGPVIHLSDGDVIQDPDWPTWDRAKAVATRTLWQDRAASHHLIRLAGSEKPHVHDSHDLTVFVLKGKVRVHLGDRAVELKPGDVVQIPHGLRHWAQNIDAQASEAYVVFSPPYQGKDKRLVD